jgi:acetyl esterase
LLVFTGGRKPIMPLDPDVQRFLDMLKLAAPRPARLTPAEMRLGFHALAHMVDRRDAPVGSIENASCPGPSGALPIRIYTPVAAGAARTPGIVFFHGGGWIFGDLDTHEGLCRRLAHETGCRVISVAYRLAPEHKFPAGVEDCYAAATWVADNAERLQIDRRRLAVAGDSAGGNLAAVVCQTAKQKGWPDIALQVLIYPVLDLIAETPSRRAFAESYFLDKKTIDWTIETYCNLGVDPQDPRISPLRAADLSGLPPAHIHTAEFDPLLDEGKAYAERLKAAGVPVRYTCHLGMIHHFTGMAEVIPYARSALQAAGAAIKEALG